MKSLMIFVLFLLCLCIGIFTTSVFAMAQDSVGCILGFIAMLTGTYGIVKLLN